MKPSDGKIVFGPWLPDLADLDNPGLTDAKNVYPIDGGYKPFTPLGGGLLSALNARPQGAIGIPTPPASYTIYAGTSSKLYVSAVDKSGTAYSTASTGFWRFAEYNGLIIATNGVDVPQRQTFASGANFAALASTGTAPNAVHVGTVGQFVVLGSLTTAQRARIQWSAIDDPTNWPTPGTSDAITVQSGAQDFDREYGYVTGIAGSDQYGLIFQNAGISRMTYGGGNEVFQFDQFEFGRGAHFENATVQVGGFTYFISADGFCRTNGVVVEPIGRGRVDRWFLANIDRTFPQRVYGAAFPQHRCVVWGMPTSASTSGRPKMMIIYNYELDRWSYTDQEHECLFGLLGPSGTELVNFGFPVLAFNSAHELVRFNGTVGTAILTSSEVEFHPGGRAFVQGVRPFVSGSSPTVTVATGARDSQGSSVTYTSEVTPNSRTGFAGFRSDAQYHRARVTISGDFEKATGLEYQQVPSGAV